MPSFIPPMLATLVGGPFDDPDQLARLLTAIVRSDRFVEGSIAAAFESGVLAGISRRAAALLASSGSE